MADQVTYDVTSSIITQGDTGTPSVVEFVGYKTIGKVRTRLTTDLNLRVHVCNANTYADSTNATIAPTTGYGTTNETEEATKDLDIVTPVDTAPTGTLTISSVVINGETATINSRVYEFSGDGNIASTSDYAVDISGDGTASQGTLSMATKPTAGDTVTAGPRVYTFRVAALTEGDVAIGAAVANSQVNLVAAVNGTDGLNTTNPQVTAAAFATNESVFTATNPGVLGDSIPTTETFTDVTDAWDAATLGTTTAGVDVTATEAGDALVIALAADDSSICTGVNTTGTVVLTANSVVPTLYTTTEAMANGAFGGATMTGGTTTDNGSIRVSVTDGSAESVDVRIGQPQNSGYPFDYEAATITVTHAAP